jgi:hypothetical protein
MNSAELRSISLEDLRTGFPHVPPACGEHHAQAASVVFHHLGQSSGVGLTIGGDFSEVVRVEWAHEVDGPMRRYWSDLSEAVEQGAVGLAILLVKLLTGYTVVERAVKGTGIDWWLGQSDDPLFQRKARLEASGILSGSPTKVASRVRAKVEQTRQSDSSGLEALVVVVEFSTPQAEVIKR